MTEDPSDGEGSDCELAHCCICCEFYECPNHVNHGSNDYDNDDNDYP